MKIDRVLELLKIERECVTRQSPCNEKSKLCDRNCGECDIAQDDLEIIEMYDFVIGMLEMFANGYNTGTIAAWPQWISVKDRMPVELHSIFWPWYGKKQWSNAMWREQSDKVLVTIAFKDGTRIVSTGETHDGVWHTAISRTLDPIVTHWMQFPELPKEENE